MNPSGSIPAASTNRGNAGDHSRLAKPTPVVGYKRFLIPNQVVSGSPEWAPIGHNSGTSGTIRAQDSRVSRQTFRLRILSNHPKFKQHLERNHQIEKESFGEDYADKHLCALNNALHLGRINLSTATELQISECAEGHSWKCYHLLGKSKVQLQQFLSTLGIEQKLDDAFLRNLRNPRWWHSYIYKRRAEMFAHVFRALGHVHKAASPYMDPGSVQTHERNKLATRTYLEQTVMKNEQGFSISLAELADAGISNPRIRRSEMMTHLRGISDWGGEQNHAATFVTLTTPSRMHRCSAQGVRNPNYDGTSVRLAQAYLQQIWARIRAKLSRQNIDIYGMRVAEPHHDGCPHWHLLIFCAPEDLLTVKETMFHHALSDSPEENGALVHRIKFQDCDKSKGSPIAYMAKYVSKNIDGYGLTADDEGMEIDKSTQHIIAWARINRIRQFQFFGRLRRDVWRDLRKLKEPEQDETLEAARQAADRGDFKEYIELMGGTNHHDQPIFCVQLPENVDPTTGEMVGEGPSKVLRRYLQCGTTLVATQFHVWKKVALTDINQPGGYSYPHAVGIAEDKLAVHNEAPLGLVTITVRNQPQATSIDRKPELNPPETFL